MLISAKNCEVRRIRSRRLEQIAAPVPPADDLIPGAVYSWAEVSRIHRIRSGIYHRNGRLISLLTDFGRINPCYPDVHIGSGNTIIYTGNGRRGDQKLDASNRALLDAVGTDAAVPLFNKLDVGRWQFTGRWTVVEGRYIYDNYRDRMLWQFTLTREGGRITFLNL